MKPLSDLLLSCRDVLWNAGSRRKRIRSLVRQQRALVTADCILDVLESRILLATISPTLAPGLSDLHALLDLSHVSRPDAASGASLVGSYRSLNSEYRTPPRTALPQEIMERLPAENTDLPAGPHDTDIGKSLKKTMNREAFVPGRLVVRFVDGLSRNQQLQVISNRGANAVKWFPGLNSAVIDIGTSDVAISVAKWTDDPLVKRAEPDYLFHTSVTVPDDVSFSKQWGLNNTGQTGGVPDADIDAPEAWNYTRGLSDVVVAVIDSGVDYNHPDLVSNIWTNQTEATGVAGIDDDGNGNVDDIHGIDTANGDSDPMDDNNHGTHVAGIIGASGNNSIGVTGVNWNVKILPLKFLNADGEGSMSAAIEALDYITRMKRDFGVNIVASNNSWGMLGIFGFYPPAALYEAISASIDAGVLFVAAAGNDYRNNNDELKTYPASYDLDGIISVAATNDHDGLAVFSNVGEVSVDLAAPGQNILSTIPGGGYASFSGTSMATPFVTGAVALASAVAPGRSAVEKKQAILDSVDPLPELQSQVRSGGRLNLAGMIEDLQFVVSGMSRGAGSIVSKPISAIQINLSHPIEPSSVQAGDLIVNGRPASWVRLAGDRNVIFSFSENLLTTNGLQHLNIAAGAFRDLVNGEANPAWQETFRYDPQRMSVTETEPAAGTVLNNPSTLILHVNEPVDAASLSIDDLVPSQGRVTRAELVSPQTIRFTLTGVTEESSLNIKVPAGAVRDAAGNPSVEYAASYTIEFGSTPFPAAISPSLLQGSLIYSSDVVSGTISSTVDADRFTIDLDHPQTISILAKPMSPGLIPRLELTGPGGEHSAKQGANSGQAVVLQTIAANAAGRHEFVISGVNGTSGTYEITVTLNAALELEGLSGTRNDSLQSSEPLGASGISLPGGGTRGAVVGQSTLRESFYVNTLEGRPDWTFEGSWEFGEPQGAGGTYGYPDPDTAHSGKNVLGVNLNGDSVNGADDFWYVTTNSIDCTGRQNVHLNFWQWLNVGSYLDGSAATVEVSANGIDWAYALITDNYDSGWRNVDYDISEFADNQPTVYVRWGYYSYYPFSGWNIDDISLTAIAPADTDWYQFWLRKDDVATITAGANLPGVQTEMSLFDSSGTLIAASGRKPSLATIADFRAVQQGTYFLRIDYSNTVDSIVPETAYSVVITRNSDWDSDLNHSSSQAQDITSTGRVLGYLQRGNGKKSSGQLAPEYYLAWDAWQERLVRIDLDGTLETFPSDLASTHIVGLGYDSQDNRLYGIDPNGELYLIDPASGLPSRYAFLGASVGYGMAYSPDDDKLYSITADGYVVQIDPDLVTARIVSDHSNGGAGGVAVHSADRRIYSVIAVEYSSWVSSFDGRSYSGPVWNGSMPGRFFGLASNGQSLVLGGGDETDSAGTTLYGYDPHSGTMQPIMPHGLLKGIGVNALEYVNPHSVEDFYQVAVQAGDRLAITIDIPLQDSAIFRNDLDVAVELIDPDGMVVAYSATGSLTHRAGKSGKYVVRTFAENGTSGEYQLRVTGASGVTGSGVTGFRAASAASNPSGPVAIRPSSYTIGLNQVPLASSLQPSDIRLDGVPISEFIPSDDAQRLIIPLPDDLPGGTHVISIQAGSIQDVSGRPIEAFSGELILDFTPPRIVASSISEGDVLSIPAGQSQSTVSWRITFDEPINAALLDPTDISLHNLSETYTGGADSLDYDPVSRTLTVRFRNLPDDRWTATLWSGPQEWNWDNIEDLAGNHLDGEARWPLSTGTGDGTAGGDFVVSFVMDLQSGVVQDAPELISPLGSLIQQWQLDGYLTDASDADEYQVTLQPNQTVSIVAASGPALQSRIVLTGPDGSVYEAPAAGRGYDAVLQAIAVRQAGQYSVLLSSLSGADRYDVTILVNAVPETEQHNGGSNSDRTMAQNLDGSFVPLPLGGARTAVSGSAKSYETTFLFESLDANPGWQATGAWAFGVPSNGGPPGPPVGNTGKSVFGTNLELNETVSPGGPWYLTTSPFDCRGQSDVQLSFWHWLNDPGEFWSNLGGTVEVSNNGATWHTVYDFSQDYPVPSLWLNSRIDISDIADNQPTVYVRWGMEIKGEIKTPGWAIDDVGLSSSSGDGDDWYSISMAKGQSLSAGAMLLNSGTLRIEVYDSSGHLDAVSLQAGEPNQYISGYRASENGRIYLHVQGVGAPYTLFVTKDTGMSLTNNTLRTSTQELSDEMRVIGYLQNPIAVRPERPAISSQPQAQATNLATLPAGSFAADRLIVRFEAGVSISDQDAFIRSHDATLIRRLSSINAAIVQLSEANVPTAATEWSASPLVIYAEPDYRIQRTATFPNDLSEAQRDLHDPNEDFFDIDAPEAWDLSTGSRDVVVAVIDTGVDYNHPDLAANIWTNRAEANGLAGVDDDGNGYIDDIHGIDTADHDSDPMAESDDDFEEILLSHGTFISGIIGAASDNGIGIAGVNWNVSILPIKSDAFDAESTEQWLSSVVEGIDYVNRMKRDFGVNIVACNNSYGYYGPISHAHYDAVAAGTSLGILFVAGAANDHLNNDVYHFYPASYDLDGVISVAATMGGGALASFSNYGATSVDLAAPGDFIYSTLRNGTYGAGSGTSFATPFVTGAAALLAAYVPGITVPEMRAAILSGVDKSPFLEGLVATGGRLNLYKALRAAADIGDMYSVPVRSGDRLQINASEIIPNGVGSDLPLNLLIQVVASDGRVLALSSESPSQGLTLTVSADDNLTVRVFALSGRGTYQLSVTGATGDLPQWNAQPDLRVSNQSLNVAPNSYTVRFDVAIQLASLQLTDLLLDGKPLSGTPQVVRGNEVTWDLPSDLAEGIHRLEIISGSIQDLRGNAVSYFEDHFALDFAGPGIVTSSIADGSEIAIPNGQDTTDLDWKIQLNELINSDELSKDDVQLVGVISGLHDAEDVSWDRESRTVTVRFRNLPDDSWHLTLRSGDGHIEDVAGNAMIGGGAGTQSDFSVNCTTDIGLSPLKLSHAQNAAPISVVHGMDDFRLASLHDASDVDRFTFSITQPQNVSILLEGDPQLQTSITVIGPSGIIGSGGASLPGKPLLKQSLPMLSPGVYEIQVGSISGKGFYRLHALLNAVLETEAFGGTKNDSRLTAQRISNDFLSIAPGVSQATVLGHAGFRATAIPYAFDDISQTGTRIIEDVDDKAVVLTELGNFLFPFYGVNYSSLFVSSNGLITFGSAFDKAYAPGWITDPSQPSISPFWEDLDLRNGLPTSGVYWQLKGEGNERRLILQWNEVQYFPADDIDGDRITLQAILFAGSGQIRINYRDLGSSTNTGHSEGQQSRVGVKAEGQASVEQLWIAQDFLKSQLVGSQKSVVFNPAQGVGSDDWYQFSAGAGQVITITASGESQTVIELFSQSGILLGRSNSVSGITGVISGFVSPATADYYVRVVRPLTNYELSVTLGGAVGSEGFMQSSNFQPLPSSGSAIGRVSPDRPDAWYYWDVFSNSLNQLTPDGVLTLFSAPAFSVNLAGLAWDSKNGVLYGVRPYGDSSKLYRINIDTGDLTLVGQLDHEPGYGLTWNPLDEKLYSLSSTGHLQRIDPDLLTVQSVSLGATGQDAAGVAYNPVDRRIYVIYTTHVDSFDAVTYSGPISHPRADRLWNYGLAHNGTSLVVAPGGLVETPTQNFYSYDPVTGHLSPLFSPGLLTNSGIDAIEFVNRDSRSDVYTFAVQAGDLLDLATTVIEHGTADDMNRLNPGIELLGPDGNSLAISSTGSLTYLASAAGTYSVRVFSEGGTAGEYLLKVIGATGGRENLRVSNLVLDDQFRTSVSQVTIDFSADILVSSVQASDLRIDGKAAKSFNVVNGRQMTFEIPQLGADQHTLSISPGAILGLDETPVETFRFDVSAAPGISGFSLPLNFTEGSTDLLIGPQVSIRDTDSPHFGGGYLVVAITGNKHDSDQLTIKHTGSAAGQIGIDRTDVSYGGVSIGTLTSLTPLTIRFNSAATPIAVQALLQRITFATDAENPSPLTRTLEVTLSDGNHGLATASRQLRVFPVNDSPVIRGFAAPMTYHENEPGVLLDNRVTLTDPDSADFSGGQLRVDIIANAESSDRLQIENTGLDFGQIGVRGNHVTYGGVQIGTYRGDAPLIVTLNTSATLNAVEALLHSISILSTSENPSTLLRRVQLWLTDGDGGTSNVVSKTVNFVPLNDAPVIDAFSGEISWTEDTLPVVIDSDVAVTDVDSLNFSGGRLVVSITGNVQDSDRVSIRNQGIRAGETGTTGSAVTYGGVVIGIFSGTTELNVDLNSNATILAVQALLRNIVYSSVSQNPSLSPRTVSMTLDDGDGGVSEVSMKVVNVQPVNDAPVARGDALSGFENSSLHIRQSQLLTNDLDAEGDPLVISIVVAPMSGSLVQNADGSLTYTPRSGFRGIDEFQYKISDGALTSLPARVRIQISRVPGPAIGITAFGPISGLPGTRVVWNPVTYADSYDVSIQRVSDSKTVFTKQDLVTPGLTINPSLENGVYRIWVRAKENGAPLTVWGAGTVFELKNPPQLSWSNTEFRWTDAKNAVRYELWVNDLTRGTRAVWRNDLQSLTYQPNPAFAPGRYSAWIRSMAADGKNSVWSPVVTFTIYHPALKPAPQLPTVDATPVLRWNSVAGAASYELQISESISGVVLYRQFNIQQSSHRVSNPLAAGIYRFWVRVHFSDLTASAWGDGQQLVIGPAPQLQHTAYGQLAWSAVRDATQYELWINYYPENQKPQYAIVHQWLVTTSFRISASLQKGTYRAWIRAVRFEAGQVYNGSWSRPVEFTVGRMFPEAQNEWNRDIALTAGLEENVVDSVCNPNSVAEPFGPRTRCTDSPDVTAGSQMAEQIAFPLDVLPHHAPLGRETPFGQPQMDDVRLIDELMALVPESIELA